MNNKIPKIVIVGGGPSALIFASMIDTSTYEVHLYEQNNTLGRKFLVAGKGGFNLTHSEEIDKMKERYTPNYFLEKSLVQFSNKDLINWFQRIGIETFIGSSKRVYPLNSIKPIEVLKAIENQIKNNGVYLHFNHKWIGWENEQLKFEENQLVDTDITIFALGGGSWKVTGTNANWLELFMQKGVKVNSFYPSNCAYKVNWKNEFITKNEGLPLKNIAINSNGKSQKGEVVITRFGIEGNAVYALSPQIRLQLQTNKQAQISIDFKPNQTKAQLLNKYNSSKEKTIVNILKKDLKLSRTQIDLLKYYLSKKRYTTPKCLINTIKSFKILICGTDELDKAISTVGGVELASVDAVYQLNKMPNTYCIGEMLDWDAPTGGYLLQACFSMGSYLANYFNSNSTL
jgi:uncharacterized flavoprotein (TIGR03862 family)